MKLQHISLLIKIHIIFRNFQFSVSKMHARNPHSKYRQKKNLTSFNYVTTADLHALLHSCNLFVTSKNETTTNSPIREFKVLHKGQRAI